MLPTPTRAYLYSGPMDMRRCIDALALLVEVMLKRSPFCGEVFVFFNKKLDKVKLLWWDRNGFWLAYKRLEKGRFAASPKSVSCPVALRPLALGRKNWLFAGSARGGEATAVILSLIGSAKLQGKNPFAYLKDLIEHLPSAKA